MLRDYWVIGSFLVALILFIFLHRDKLSETALDLWESWQISRTARKLRKDKHARVNPYYVLRAKKGKKT